MRSHEVDELVGQYEKIKNIRAVARELRILRETAAKHLASRGIDTSRKMKPADIARAQELYAQGFSSASIGREIGFDNKTVLRAVRS